MALNFQQNRQDAKIFVPSLRICVLAVHQTALRAKIFANSAAPRADSFFIGITGLKNYSRRGELGVEIGERLVDAAVLGGDGQPERHDMRVENRGDAEPGKGKKKIMSAETIENLDAAGENAGVIAPRASSFALVRSGND